MNVHYVTFDLDDTLWSVGPVIMRAERLFYDWLSAECPRITESHSLDALTAHRRTWMQQFPDERHDLTTLRKRWIGDIFEAFDYHGVSVDEAFRVFWELRNEVELYDEVPDAIRSLRERYRLGVITNGNACVHHIGIGHWFDFVVSSEAAGHAKPAPQIFHTALAEAGTPAERVVHVGDDPTNDVIGAAGVGMRTVWYNPAGKPWPGGTPPDETITSLNQLDAAVARIAA